MAATRPALIREEVTSGQHCEGSQPFAGLDKLLIKPPTWAGPTPAAPPGTDESVQRHSVEATWSKSHEPGETTNANPASQVPDQPL
jgi:hypothetical protein